MSLLVNGSFETGDTAGWTTAGQVSVSTSAARSGVYGCSLFFNRSSPKITQTVDLTSGQAHTLTAWVKLDTSLQSSHFALSASTLPYAGDVVETTILDSVSATGDWQILTVSFVPDGSGRTDVTLYVFADQIGVSGPSWFTDDVDLSVVAGIPMGRHLHTAYADIVTRLLTINGASGGYYHDLGNRVYCRLVTPQDSTSAFPYLTALVLRPVRYDFGSGTSVTATLTVSVIGFVNEAVQLDAANSATTTALKLLEDITRALLPATGATQWDIGSATIDNLRVVPQQVSVGLNDGYEYAEIPVEIEVDIRFARADLGPTA